MHQRNVLYFVLCALLQLLKNEIVTLFSLINHGCHVTVMQKSAVWHISDYVVKVYFMNEIAAWFYFSICTTCGQKLYIFSR